LADYQLKWQTSCVRDWSDILFL